ncbi:MAG: potassium transporter Kup [Bacteriovoracaceae bacterium]|nr:potassium transporter Kup [Bacteriovoracaceae bacterium]
MSHSSTPKALLALSALGIVYGDIGTSPLYALKESFHHTHNVSLTPENIMGVLSLIFWSLIIIISIKYLVLIVRADNKGEGGILALTALIQKVMGSNKHQLKVLSLLGIFGTALLYGDGVITPAISVLSAVEGLELIAPGLHSYILPITILILIALFMIQRKGTAAVGRVFGPITLVWFIVLGILGLLKIFAYPQILMAMNPWHGVNFVILNSWHSMAVLGAVFLVVTGGEALYSDLGHFGRTPIRWAWFVVVLPALVLNYFGQGALLIENPLAIKNPFYLLAPHWALVPLIILATLSTVIASQALITGVFSLTMQAVQLQYMPRVKIDHTSKEEFGQVYVGSVNTLLMLACITVVLSFKTSSALAAAYGIAVTTTMVITTVLFYFIAVHLWKWKHWQAFIVCSFFLAIEGLFWGANLLKIVDGGWFPMSMGLIIFTLMTTWKTGRKILSTRMMDIIIPLKNFLLEVTARPPQRVPGMAIYMSGHPDYAPAPLMQSYRHFNCLHETLVFLSVVSEGVPNIPMKNRLEIESPGGNIYRVTIHYGFMDLPNIPRELAHAKFGDKVFDLNKATFFLGRENLIATEREGMMIWREKLFAIMSRNALPATRFFQLPAERVVEIGSIIEL